MSGDTATDGLAIGYLLAETLHEPDGGARTRGCLTAASARRLAVSAQRVGDDRRDDRLTAMARWARHLVPIVDPVSAERSLPPRALALLAPLVPREAGQRWTDAVTPHRPSYRPPADLVGFLRDLGAAPPSPSTRSEEPRWPT